MRVLAALALTIVLPCGCAPQRCQFVRYRAAFERVTPDGEVVFKDGETVKLAGLRMRSTDATEEPDLLDMVNGIIPRETDRVEVELDTDSKEVVVYYKQPIFHFDTYIPIAALVDWIRPPAKGSVNELLIVMAAARYDPSCGAMTDKALRACQLAQEKADLARWTKYRYRPLSEYGVRKPGQLYTNRDGYRARIAKGDVEERDRNLSDYESSSAHLASDMAMEERIPALVEALKSDNRFLRRHAAQLLGEIGPDARAGVSALTEALVDEDRHVRVDAATSLGEVGAVDDDVRKALLNACNDSVDAVAAAAKEALRLLTRQKPRP